VPPAVVAIGTTVNQAVFAANALFAGLSARATPPADAPVAVFVPGFPPKASANNVPEAFVSLI
jgi:Ni,Fe-hydrogenase III small subunit